MNPIRITSSARGALGVLEITFGDTASPDARDELLVAGTEALVTALVTATAGTSAGVALDIRTADDAAPGLASAHRAAFIDACHGLVHAYVAEEGTAIGPVNIVVSAEAQQADRELTLELLASPDGEFTRGAVIDLRDAA